MKSQSPLSKYLFSLCYSPHGMTHIFLISVRPRCSVFVLPIKALLAQLCALVLHLQYEAAPPPPLPPDRSEMFLALQWRRLHRPASRRQAGQDVGELRGGPELCSLARPDRGEEERREGGLTVAVVRSRRSCSRTCAPPSTLTGTRCPLPGPATPGRSV